MHEQGALSRDDASDPVRPGDGASRVTPFLGTILDQFREAALMSDPEGMIRHANPAAAAMFGAGSIVGRPVSDLIDASPEAAAVLLAAVDSGLAQGGTWRGRLPRVGRDRSPFTTDARVSIVPTEGRPFRLWLEERAAADAETRDVTEARLALSIAAGRMAVWDYDLASDQVTASPDLLRLMGFPPDADPTTDEIRDRYYPGERERLRAEGRAALGRGERFVESEFRYRWPDGSVHWVLLRAQAMLNQTGRPVRALGIVMDVTERKRAEEALRASEARLTLAQGAAGIGIWDWDLRTGEITWSPGIYRLLGLDPAGSGAPRGRTWSEALHRDDRAAATAAVRQAVRDGVAFSIDFRLRGQPAAPPRWLRSHGAPVRDADGEPSRFVGINMEVTEERRREERLLVAADDLRGSAAKAERERERIYDLSNELFAAIGPAGDVAALNPAWARLLGRDAPTLRGSRFLDLVHPEDRARAAEGLAAARGGAGLRQFEARIERGDRDALWIAWAAAAEEGVVYAVGRDVTLDKARDAALAQAQKMEALGQLTGGITHDFNNLLQAVSGYLELIRRQPGDPAKVDLWAATALQASERGTKLTGQLLAFSRAEQVEVAAVPVEAVLTELADLLERTLGTTAQVRLHVPELPLGVMADRTQLETALLNLAINARDAMPNGGMLTIAAEPVTLPWDVDLPPGDYVAVRVRDTGVGMSGEVAARAFDPFFTTKGVGKGTGLGLSQVYGMARHAGGMARIESRPGEGTTVSLLLPRVPPPTTVLRGSEASSGGTGPPARATVLVVDDDLDVRSLLADTLASLGYAVLLAADGPSALTLLERTVPDVVLLDFAMPGMNGAEVARAALARHPGLAIVFATGHADAGMVDAAIGTEAPRLRKPFRMRELAAVLATMTAGNG